MHFEQMHTVFIICTGTNANKPMVYQSCLFPLEYNEPSKCQVYKLRDRTHAGNTASCMTIAGQLVEGVGDVFFCKKLSKKLYCIILPYIHYLLHSRPTNFRAKEAWKKNNTIFVSSPLHKCYQDSKSSNLPQCHSWNENQRIDQSVRAVALDRKTLLCTCVWHCFGWMVLVICFWKEWFYTGFMGVLFAAAGFLFVHDLFLRVLRTQNSPWHWRSSSHSCASYP